MFSKYFFFFFKETSKETEEGKSFLFSRILLWVYSCYPALLFVGSFLITNLISLLICLLRFSIISDSIFFFFVVNFVIHWNEKALGSHVFPIPIPPPTSLPTRSLQVLPEHQVRALVSYIQPGPVICFTLDSLIQSWEVVWF